MPRENGQEVQETYVYLDQNRKSIFDHLLGYKRDKLRVQGVVEESVTYKIGHIKCLADKNSLKLLRVIKDIQNNLTVTLSL